MSTLGAVQKGLNSIAAPQLIGADYGTRGSEFWMFNGPDGLDYKFSYTGHHSSLKAYTKCPPLNAIINKKAQAFVNGKTWILNKKGKGRDKEATGPIAMKVKALMAKPNPFQSQKEFEAQQYIYLQTFGFCFMIPVKPTGFPNIDATRLWNIPPSMVDVEETKKNWLLAESNKDVIKRLVIDWGNEKSEIPMDMVWIVKDFTPSFNSPVFPESRVCANEMPINNIIGAYESRNVLINYRGALGIISSDGKDPGGFIPIKEDEKEELQQDFRRYGLSRRQWQFIITSASVKWTQMGVATKDLMLFEEVEDDIMRLCDGWNFPYPLMASSKTNNLGGSNTDPNKALLYQDTIIPEAESICEQWASFFDLEKYGLVMEKDFSHVPALQGDEQKKAQARKSRNEAYQIEFLHNVCTLDEWRVANGDDPIGGEFGGKYYYELVAVGWRFGSTGASLSLRREEENGAQQSSGQTNNQGGQQ